MHHDYKLARHGLRLQGSSSWLSMVVVLVLGSWTSACQAEEPGFEILDRGLVDDIEQAYVSYPSGDLKVTGWLFVNPFSEADVEPCVIFNHGGVGGVSEGTREKCRWLAKQGYIVFAPSYRGEDDSEGEIEVAAGEVDDVLAAMKLLENHPGIVPGQFALMGTSHGALISVKALARPEARNLVRAVVAAYGVMEIYDWYQYLLDNEFDVSDDLSRRIYGHGPKDKPEAFASRNAVDLVGKLSDAPIFLVQGALDEVVPKQQALTMIEALKAAGRTQDVCRVYEHGAHGFIFWDDPERHTPERLEAAKEAWNDILRFLDDSLEPSVDLGRG